MEQIHYIYKITFLKGSLKDHYYIGKRTFKPLLKKLEWTGFRTPQEALLHDPMYDIYTGSGKIVKDYFTKYPKVINETFIKEILIISNSYNDNVKNEEKIIGDKYKKDDFCLNIIKGGMFNPILNGDLNPTHKRVLTEEQRKKISEKSKEHWAKHNVPWKGKKRTEEEKKKISNKLKEYFKTHDNPNKGKKMSEESKQKSREVHIKLWEDPEYRKKTMEAQRKYLEEHGSPLIGKKISEETKKKLSDYFKGRPNPKNAGKNNGMYGKKPKNVRSILQYDMEGKIIKEWESIADVKKIGFNPINVGKVCRKERKHAHNYIWRYKDDVNLNC